MSHFSQEMSANGLDLTRDSCKALYVKYPQFEKYFDLLFTHTQYYTLADVTDHLQANIVQWKATRQDLPLYVYYSNEKVGSEQYFYNRLKSLLPPHKVVNSETVTAEINGGEVLFLDDWALSGHNAAGNMENLLYDLCSHLTKVHVSFIFAICSKEAKHLLDGLFTDSKPYNDKVNSSVYCTLGALRFDSVLQECGVATETELAKEFCLTFNPDTEMFAYPIHLEYKIANQFGSYPEIYTQCRDPPERSFMTVVPAVVE